MKRFKNFKITATEQDIDEFVAIDDENSNVFQENILEKANRFFEEQQSVNEDENITSDEVESMDVDTTSQMLQAKIFFVTFTQRTSFWKESSLQQKCKLLLVTTMESYSPF